eukprot:GEMP01139687.1.p3 GENE.GEMP01139687.1~~GEMP01139687.1.p3  ORF type:complete len:108 (-),score=18.35 GEMP01139687.1:53-376(-)
MLTTGLLVVHDAVRSSEDNVAELAGRQQIGSQLFHITGLDIKARGDNTALVDATVEVDNDLAGTVVIDDLEVANVAILLHNLQELDDNLRARSDEDLPLTGLLGVQD